MCVCIRLIACTRPIPKSHIYDLPPNLFGVVPQSYLRCSLPGCSLHFAPNKTNHSSHVGTFLSWGKKEERGREGKRKIDAGYLCLIIFNKTGHKCLLRIYYLFT